MGCFATTAVSAEKAVLGSKLKIVHLKGYGGVPVVVILLLFVQRERVRSKENEKLISYAANRLMSFCWANCHNAAAIIGYFHKENRQYRGRQAILRTESSFTENDLQHFGVNYNKNAL